jgi:hypothetical protein
MATLIGTASNQIPTNGDLGTMAFQDSASISVGAISIGSGIPTIVANATTILVGNSTVNATINSTSFSGTSANATNLNSQPYTYYTNAGNITSGTLPYAQIPANVINTTANYTIPGIHTHTGGIAFSNTVTANGSNGTAGYVLTSAGATGNVYWAAGGGGGSGTVTSIAFANGLSGGTITTSGSVNVLAGNTQLISNTSGIWLDQTKVDITQLSNYSTVTGYITSNAAIAYTNAVSYVTAQSFANTLQVTSNAATAYTNAITYSGNAAQAYSNAVTYITTANFTVSGMHTYANGITFSNTVTANGSNGTAGQVLTSSGTTGNVYWAASVNTAAQYTWSNTQSFTNTITFANTNINNIVLSGNTSNVSAVNFYVSSGLSSGAVGSLFWHNADGTLNVQMDTNVSSALNQCQYFYVKASSTITIGQVCMITGAVGASGVLTAGPATGVTDGTYIMGIAAENIALNGFGYIQSFGPLKGFNLSAFAVGDILFYDTASTGGLTTTAPSSPNPVVQVAAVIHNGSGGSGSIFIRVTSRGKLKYQGDVLLTTPVNSDVLVYNSTTSLWVNSPTVNNATNLGGQPSTYYAQNSAIYSTFAQNTSVYSTFAQNTSVYSTFSQNSAVYSTFAQNTSVYSTFAQNTSVYSTFAQNTYLTTNYALLSGGLFTGSVNAASFTIGSNFIANTVQTTFGANVKINTGISILDSTGSQGTTGQVLTSNGAANVYWSTPSSSSTPLTTITTITSNYTVLSTDNLILCNSTSPIIVTLLSASSYVGKTWTFKNINTGSVTILPAGSDKIDGFSNMVMQFKYSAFSLTANSTGWIMT